MWLFHNSMNIKGLFFLFLLLVCFIKNADAQYKSGFSQQMLALAIAGDLRWR